jgi:microcompartment protein CcmK/EutM
MITRRLGTVALVSLALVAGACSSSKSTSSSNGAHVLLVGTFDGKAGQYKTIQSAVDAAKSGDWILVAPGDYHEQYDHTQPIGEAPIGGVYITTPNLHLRGMDRNKVVVDGTKPAAPQCSSAQGDQDFGPLNSSGKPTGRNGIEVWKASGTSIDNLTVCNFMKPAGGDGGNQIWWNFGDGTGVAIPGAYSGSYLSTTATYFAKDGEGEYGIFSSNTNGPGLWTHTYASNMADSDYYVGACADCNMTIDDAHAQYSTLGYSGTNAGGHLIIKNSEWDHNKTGLGPNSLNNDDAPSPQDGACPDNGTGPTGSHSCTVFENNYIHDNNNPNVPATGIAGASPVGTGIFISGGRNDTIANNRIEHNGAWGVLVVLFPDTGTPPPVAHCVGGDPNGLPALGLKGCLYPAFGNEVAGNAFQNNGAFGNPTNGDIGLIAEQYDPGNCFHGNTDPGGVTTSPANLQQTHGACGTANAGASITSDVASQVICATELFGPCPSAPGKVYPRSTQVSLPGLTPQPTMPNPCDGVPGNPWCTKSGPVSGMLPFLPFLPPLAGAARRRREPSRLRTIREI